VTVHFVVGGPAVFAMPATWSGRGRGAVVATELLDPPANVELSSTESPKCTEKSTFVAQVPNRFEPAIRG
jgi:hypothetical protein